MAARVREFLQRHIIIAHCLELAILLLLLYASASLSMMETMFFIKDSFPLF